MPLCAGICIVGIYRVDIALSLYTCGGAIVLFYTYVHTYVCMYVCVLLGVYESHRVYMYACLYVCAIVYMSTYQSVCLLLCACEAMIM